MTTSRRRSSTVRCHLARAVLLAACALSSVADANVAGSTTQLSTATSNATVIDTQTTPAISGTGVVWTDNMQFVAGGSTSDIFYVDVASGQPARNLTNTPFEQEFLEDIDGSNVVYTHVGGASTGDIVLLDFNVGVPTTIAGSDATVRYEQPSLSGNNIVYVRSLNGQYDIDGYDLLIGAPFAHPITNDPAVQARPRISGNTVVWEDYNSGNADVVGYDLSTGAAPFLIAGGPDTQEQPDVSGNTVVYVDSANGVDQIWSYDLTTRTGHPLTTAVSHKISPRVSGSRVVWADDRSGNFDIYSYDLGTNFEDVLVAGPGDQILAAIDGSRVVYTSNANGLEEVFLFSVMQALPPPNPKGPVGCDPALTDLVDGPVTLTKVGKRPTFHTEPFATVPGKTYYVCLQNGLADRSLRTMQVLISVDDTNVITPSDLRPANDPPSVVAETILDGKGHGHHPQPGDKHSWTGAVFGANPAQIQVSIRVHK